MHYPPLRFALPALVLLLPLLSGCVRVVEEPGQTVWAYSWFACLAPVAVGLGVMGCGVRLIRGDWKLGNKPHRLGWFLLAVGTLAVGAVAATTPFARVTVSDQRLTIQEGLIGVGVTQQVDLQQVASIDLYRASRKRVGKKKRGRRIVTYAEFTSRDGTTQEVFMGGDLRGPALQRVLEIAQQRGVAITDRRAETP
ncbi:hypothetical protein Pla175_03520 [Pirellulimonas nuda]|uniref:Uncharacterized protein n=1 Tax=Pirellulimonas nuda TaxID=2528009 RepID=A0A518D696_9BACT|nr:hypothetical protein [Pirellulimonas nuda]QDU86998.1 hypothetical protein Pla175_03520 [Pirellulimonas nuda]